MPEHLDPYITVVDNRFSALALVATQRSKILPTEICYASDFKDPNSLLDYLLASDRTRILFAWRGALRETLEIASGTRRYQQLLESKTVHMLVPDLLGANPKFLTSEARLVSLTHGYWVTSNELRQIYTLLFPLRMPTGVLHDMPNVSLIRQTREMKLKRSGVIWVGNSHWGSNHGYVDHKGFAEVVLPLSKRNLPFTPFRIRDSWVGRTSNEETLREIARSEILIQASAHEGTGLPLLEALGLGTIPITSDVGIAREVLTGELEHLIVERNAHSFEQKIGELGASYDEISNLCISSFESYIEKVNNESIEWERLETKLDEIKENFFVAAKVRLIWLYRFYRAKWNR